MRLSNSILCLFTGIFDQKGGLESFNEAFLHAGAQTLSDVKWTVLLLNDVTGPTGEFGANVILRPCASPTCRLFSKITLVWRFLICVVTERPSLIICGHINFVLLGWLGRSIFGIKYVLFAHGIEVWHISGLLKRSAIALAFRICCVSRYTSQRLSAQFPALRGRLIILPDTVDTDAFCPGPPPGELSERYRPNAGSIILTVSRLCASEDYKGHKVMLQALPRVLEVKPESKYLIVGAGDLMSELKAKAAELAIEGSVVFTGFVPDSSLLNYYRLCDVFAMPSKGEGFGIVFLEALSCGKPVIAGDRDGSRDPLLDGELGLLVDPDDPGDVAAALIDVLTGSVRAPLTNSDYLRQRTIEAFGKERFRERTGSVLREIVAAAQYTE